MHLPAPKTLGWLLACVLVSVLPYATGLDNGFVWLDHAEILEGGLIVAGPGELLALLSDDRNFAGYHRPLYNLAHSLDLWLWGPRPFGFHLSSLLLHGLSVGLVFALATRLRWPAWGAALLAALWGLHPINAEVAGLVHAKADLLAAVLTLGAVALLLEGLRRQRQLPWLAASLGLHALALHAKEIAFIYPLVLAAWWLARRRALPGSYVLAACAVSAAALLHRFAVAAQVPYTSELDLLERAATFGSVYLLYLRKLLVPVQLYLADTTLRFSAMGTGRVLVAVLLLAAVGFQVAAWRSHAWTRKWIVLYHLALLPVAQLVPLLHFQAERYLHLPSLAFAGALAEALVRRASAPGAGKVLVAPAAVAILALFAWIDLGRVRTFRDDFTLFGPEVERNPGYREGLSMLARACEREGRFAAAEQLYLAALAQRPGTISYLDVAGTSVNLTANLLAQQRPAEVRALAEQLLPRIGSARHARELRYNVAVADYRLGRHAEALPVLSAYADDHPADSSAHYLAGTSAQKLGRPDLARRHLRAYLELQPDAPDAAEVRAALEALGR